MGSDHRPEFAACWHAASIRGLSLVLVYLSLGCSLTPGSAGVPPCTSSDAKRMDWVDLVAGTEVLIGKQRKQEQECGRI